MTADDIIGSTGQRRGSIGRRAIVLSALCLLLLALMAANLVHDAVIEVLAAGEQAISRSPVLGAVMLVALAATSAMLAFVSVAVVVPVAVYTWGVPFSLLLLWLGWLLGGILTYGIGRLPGRAVVRWMTAGAMLPRLEDRLGRHASFGWILLLQLGLPSEIPGYLLGLSRYPFWRYLLALALAELPYAVATIYISAGFIERRGGLLLTAGLAAIALSAGAFHLLGRSSRLQPAPSLESGERHRGACDGS
jgi:uncharacterized membrane protein YdjX (TVP38/TMEM64 family)